PFVSFSSCAAHAAPLSSLSLHDALPIFLRPVRTAIGECSGREAAPGAVSSDLSVDRGGGRTSVDEGMRFPSPIACSALRGTAAPGAVQQTPEVPMQPTRRHLLHTAGAGGLVGALALLVPDLAAAAPQLEDDQFEELASRWVDQLTGRHLLTPGQARFDELIEDIDADADEFVDQLNPAGSDTVFTDLDYEQDPNVTTTVRRL